MMVGDEIDDNYWKEVAMTLLMQVRRLLPRMSNEEIKKYEEEINIVCDKYDR